MYKIIGADQREYGPVSADDLRRWIAERRVNAQTLVWMPGMDAWRPLGSLPEFAGSFTAPAYSATAQYAPASKTNGMALAGLIFACLGIPCCMTIFFPLLGLIFSIIGVAQTGGESGKSGRNIAIAGLVISALTLFIAVFLWVLAAIGAATDSGSHNYQL
jgi:hypothetical protein